MNIKESIHGFQLAGGMSFLVEYNILKMVQYFIVSEIFPFVNFFYYNWRCEGSHTNVSIQLQMHYIVNDNFMNVLIVSR